MDNQKYLTVSGLNRYLGAYIAQDVQLNNVLVKGELSNVAYTSQGHIYFTLKEESSVIKCVIFRSITSKIKFRLEDGMSVFVEGRVGIYEGSSTYNIYVKDIQLDGIGSLFQQFEQLKVKLAKEGLFDQEHKLPIPSMPSRVAILCGGNTAAQADIYRTIKNRFPFCQMFFFPVKVSGQQAVDDIIATLTRILPLKFPLVIIARGGGSFEDLYCFNDENLARFIYNYPIPIITGIGHETDTTIADFVADYRAATPTAAAVVATVDVNSLLVDINSKNAKLFSLIKRELDFAKKQLSMLENNYILKNPDKLYASSRMSLDLMTNRLNHSIKSIVTDHKSDFNNTHHSFISLTTDFIKAQQNEIGKKQLIINQIIKRKMEKSHMRLEHNLQSLDNLSPLKVMNRGYSIVRKDNEIIKTAKQLEKNDEITVTFGEGSINARVE